MTLREAISELIDTSTDERRPINGVRVRRQSWTPDRFIILIDTTMIDDRGDAAGLTAHAIVATNWERLTNGPLMEEEGPFYVDKHQHIRPT